MSEDQALRGEVAELRARVAELEAQMAAVTPVLRMLQAQLEDGRREQAERVRMLQGALRRP